MKRTVCIILILCMSLTQFAFAANDSKNLNERIELTNEDKEYFETIGVNPNDVILLAKWSENNSAKNQSKESKDSLKSRYGADVKVYYEYQLASEQISNENSTRGTDPGGSDYTWRYRTAWLKNFSEPLGNSLKEETAKWLDRPVSIGAGLLSPVVWIPMTALNISPSRFMPDYYPGDQFVMNYSDTMTDKVYSAYCSKVGSVQDVLSVRHSAVTVSGTLMYYDVIDQAVHHYPSDERVLHEWSNHYNDYSWISSQIAYQSQQYFPRLVLDNF